jgi:hypothetical protein
MDSTRQIWLAATLAEGRLVYLPPATSTSDQPGTLRDQHWAIGCCLADPDPDRDRANERMRRMCIHHARRAD